jgi:hypothetical protein
MAVLSCVVGGCWVLMGACGDERVGISECMNTEINNDTAT